MPRRMEIGPFIDGLLLRLDAKSFICTNTTVTVQIRMEPWALAAKPIQFTAEGAGGFANEKVFRAGALSDFLAVGIDDVAGAEHERVEAQGIEDNSRHRKTLLNRPSRKQRPTKAPRSTHRRIMGKEGISFIVERFSGC